MIWFTGLTVSSFLGACHPDCMCRNEQSVLAPLAARVHEFVDEIGLSMFLEGPFFDSARSTVAMARSAKVDCTGLGSLYTWFLYWLKTGEVSDLSEGRITVSRRRPLDGDVRFARRGFPARSVCFAVDQLFLMDEGRAEFLAPTGLQGQTLMQRVVICLTPSPFPILMKTRATTGSLLMCLLIITSMFMPVFAETLTPFLSSAVQLT